MSTLNTDIMATYVASETIAAGSRVKYVGAGQIANAGATDVELGVAILYSGKDSYASGDPVGVQMRWRTQICKAAGAFADGATVQRMASGAVDDTGAGAAFGIALEASAASGDLVEVFPVGHIAPPAVIGASTNIDAVPGSFADVAAVRTYLAGANVIPNIESRLDALEAKVNAIIAALS